ncbi:PLD nuclease N-terminal domain-containing protein [Cellulomonas humilata]|uniref:Heme/copper-type cytochrome/quinol oxidase subunit 2 n=1 Tax=Cellulomonas humilata TaxID=144055 RepID=A0ABU0EIZ1_9CELL|nr:PLD nuclease N-terminal domain-containing protein [Cellulomonas humilata]MDQ0375253.1 heme/copper-type cytochrome/quinol oxidase subunit 2 [Cellulomonas humilata]
MRNLAVLVVIGLIVYCVIDVIRSTDDERLGVHPIFWVALILVVPLIGALVWLAVRWSRRTAGGPDTSSRNRRATGPDDDPDFLSRLDDDRRRADPGASDDAPPSAT